MIKGYWALWVSTVPSKPGAPLESRSELGGFFGQGGSDLGKWGLGFRGLGVLGVWGFGGFGVLGFWGLGFRGLGV